jgi:hypothetical protein
MGTLDVKESIPPGVIVDWVFLDGKRYPIRVDTLLTVEDRYMWQSTISNSLSEGSLI